MISLSRAILKLKPIRRIVLDVHRCEHNRALQRFHQAYRVERYERDLETLPRKTDVFVISFPKSGRTWHRYLLGNYLASLRNRTVQEAASVEKLTADETGRRTRYDHNGANFADAILPTHEIVANSALWAGRKVIFLGRNPKDVLVSAWHHARFRQSSYSGTIQEFVRSPYAGIDKILVAHNRWWRDRGRAQSYLTLSYERMHQDLAGVLRDTLDFIGWPIDEQALERSVIASSFDNMRAAERSAAVEHKSLRDHSGMRDRSDQRGRKVRSGKVGGYQEHLTAADIDFIDAAIRKQGDPFGDFGVTPARG